ncbi:MAG: hypothetical protein ACK41O_24895, partial [Runella zeae]
MIDSLYRHDNDLIQVRFASKDAMIQHYQNALQIELVNQKSTVLRLSIEDALPQKGKAVLSKLLEAYSFSALA